MAPRRKIPPYGHRKEWIPRTIEDFGDGGAFPEIHIVQYPLNMGKDPAQDSKTVPITLDSQGRIKYDALINPSGKRNVQARHDDLQIKLYEEESLKRPDPETEAQVAEQTKKALESIVNTRISAAQPTNPAGVKDPKAPTYIRYTPAQQGAEFNSGAGQRIIRLTEMQQDPLEPPKFKHKKAPRGPPSPPVPVMHSPPRKLTIKDQQDWKIPPCISNWKNNKGFTISLDKRLASDGRGLQETVINDNFAKVSEALYIAERQAREEVAKRAEIEKRLKLKEKEKKEEMLRKLAQEARMERTVQSVSEDNEAPEDAADAKKREREQIRMERQRERERDLRMQRNKSAASRNADRDIGERIALGQAVPQASSETMYDQRLFNQTEGLQSGFGDEDDYSVYTKPLFSGSSANAIYKPKKGDEDSYGGEEDYKKLLDTTKFKPDKDFTGVDRSKAAEPRNKPVEFEKVEEDPFGLDEFLSQAKTSSKGNALDKIGSQGHMKVASSNLQSASEGGSKRGRIAFESEGTSKRNKY
jgi:SNW domain-containing protein 1